MNDSYSWRSPMLILIDGECGKQLKTCSRTIFVRDSSECHSLTQNDLVAPSTTKSESLCTMGAGSTMPPARSSSKSSGRCARNSSRSMLTSCSSNSAGGNSTGSDDSSNNRAAAGDETSLFLWIAIIQFDLFFRSSTGTRAPYFVERARRAK